MFLKDKLIRSIWQLLTKEMTMEDCFGRAQPNMKISKTYAKIYEILKKEYELDLPLFWQ